MKTDSQADFNRLQPPLPGARARLDNIQLLRAYAAWLVVFHHFHQVFNGMDRSSAWGRWLSGSGDYAVHVFFVISGFIIHHTLSRTPLTAGAFLKRRLLRIAIPYWVATLLFTAVIFGMLDDGWRGMWGAEAFLMSLVFVAHPHPSGFGLFPILPVGWSLNYEVLYYTLVAASLLLFDKRWMLPLACLLLALPWGWQASWPYGAVLSQPIWMLFPAGMLLSWLHQRGGFMQVPGMWWLPVCAAVTTLALASPWGESLFLKMGMATLLVAVALCAQARQGAFWTALVRLGDWSYATYLIHIVILFSIEKSSWMEVASRHKVLACLVYGLLVLTASWIFHRWVERPFLHSSPKVWPEQARLQPQASV